MFPNEDDDREYFNSRFGEQVEIASDFTTVNEMADDMVRQMREKYRSGKSSAVARTSCRIMNLTDLTARATGLVREMKAERLPYAEKRELAGAVKRQLENALLHKVDTAKVDLLSLTASDSTNDVFTAEVTFQLRDILLERP